MGLAKVACSPTTVIRQFVCGSVVKLDQRGDVLCCSKPDETVQTRPRMRAHELAVVSHLIRSALLEDWRQTGPRILLVHAAAFVRRSQFKNENPNSTILSFSDWMVPNGIIT